MKILVAQLNPLVGDIEGNLEKMKKTLNEYVADKPDLIVFPELFLTGYPPRDLLEKPWFMVKVEKAVDEITELSKKYPDTGVLFGAPQKTGKQIGKGLYNAATLVCGGEVIGSQAKSLLPNYDVFDEERYFDHASDVEIVPFKGELLGISVCEDAWNSLELWNKKEYNYDPLEKLALKGATIFINISASPFHMEKEEVRYEIVQRHAKKHKIPFLYVNQVGGNDELVFDGRSIFIDSNGEPVEIFPAFEEKISCIDSGSKGRHGLYRSLGRMESLYKALVLGLQDYIKKCGFNKAILGLSGGIDSALACCLAVEAVGRENVIGVTMPSPYSSEGSVKDSEKLAQNLGIEIKTVPISPIYNAYRDNLKDLLGGSVEGITDENIQARVRGNILMALSNKSGALLLSTGNKSELAVGYCTLYGDMSGGLSVIADVPKTMVYELSRYINRNNEIIPWEIITKAPSAELKPDQRDQDTLPSYEILDNILECYVDKGYSAQQIIDLGINPDTVNWVIKTVDHNEYKRKQAAPGLKVTTKAFGVGRRMPIAAKYQA